jgi:hypothetical protein
METQHTPDHQSQIIWAVLVLLGAVLAVAGWYNWAY